MSAPPSRPTREPTRGFAMPVAVLVMVVVSMLALTGLYIANNNLAANTGIHRSWKALYAADAGAAHLLATWDAATYGALGPGDSTETDWRTLPDGSLYRSNILRVDSGSDSTTSLYRVRTIGRPSAGITARRAIVTMVRASRATGACCEAALRIQGALDLEGTGPATKIDGLDADPPAWGGACSGADDDLPGLSIRDEDDLESRGLPRIDGSPPVEEDPSIDDSSFADFGGTAYDELAGHANKVYSGDQHFTNLGPSIVNGTCNTPDPNNWGDPLTPDGACWDYIPIVHVAGDAEISGNSYGQGVLLVDGDLDISGTVDFYGVIIVRGAADVMGTVNIRGGMLVRNGPGGSGNSYLRGAARVLYSSCVAARILTRLNLSDPLAGRHWFEVLD